MRNLKKILALVLALVMSFSLLATANAFEDSKDIDGTFEEAVEVLAGLKVFQGYDDGKTFQPKGEITRAEVAAIIYRIVTGDVNDKQVGIYADYNKFDDVKSGSWYAGYVNFCANAEIIKGYDAKTFGPNDKVTGYQALAMILRAIGYDKNGEFTGSGWQVQTAAVGKKLGVTDNITAGMLGQNATREVVAEILFQAILVPQVDYTLAFGYQDSTLSGKNPSIGTETFKLVKGERTTIDNWGRPGYQWFAYSNRAVVATIDEAYLYATNVAVAECDIAKAVGQTANKTYDVYDNDSDKTGTQQIRALATTATVGAQGQIVEVYKDRIVKIDTLLAQVVSVADATYDRNNHLATPSKITLDVFQGDTDANPAVANNTIRVIDTNGDENYAYAAGDYVLVNAHLTNLATTRNVIADWQSYVEYVDILGLADSRQGAQTVIWYQAGQHTVDGATYDDADRFHLNVNTTSAANRTWFFDQFGNLIGNVEIATQYSYAVIKNLWWAPDVTTGGGEAKATLVYMDGSENTVTVSRISAWNTTSNASVAYTPVYSGYNSTSDMATGTVGTTNVLYIASNAYANAVSNNNTNSGIIGGHLFAVSAGANDTVVLAEVTDQLNTATITSKYAVVSGTGAKTAAGDNSVLVNANTQFLVYNTAAQKFETYAGFNAIPNFSRGAATMVDYKEDGTGYAKYVYVIGQPDTTTSYNFVMPLSVNYSAQLQTTGGISYYVVTVVNVGGEQTTLKVKVADKAAVLDVLTAAANTNKLYYVTFTGDYATSLTLIDRVNMNHPSVCDLPGLDDNLNASVVADNANADSIVRTGNDVWFTSATNSFHFNVTDATEIVGTLPEGRQTGKTVYILHDVNTNVATKVWVVDNGSSVVNPTAPALTGLTVTVNQGVTNGAYVNSVQFAATATNSNVAGSLAFGGTVTATPVWQKLNTTTGVYENYTGDAFVPGTYRAVVTLTVNNAAGQYYTIADTAAISYYGQAGKVGASFVTDPIAVA